MKDFIFFSMFGNKMGYVIPSHILWSYSMFNQIPNKISGVIYYPFDFYI